MCIKKESIREEAARLRCDWLEEKAILETALNNIRVALANVSTSTPQENIEQAEVLQNSILRRLEERQRDVHIIERESFLKERLSLVDKSYSKLSNRLLYFDLARYQMVSLRDLKELNPFREISDPAVHSANENTDGKSAESVSNEDVLRLEGVLTDWQKTSARIIERELLAPRRIGSLCCFSSESALLAMQLAFMVRVALIHPDMQRAIVCLRLLEFWEKSQVKNIRLTVRRAFLRPQEIIKTFGNAFDALFLDYAILTTWTQEFPFSYSEIIGELEEAFPFLILLVTQNQVTYHQDLLKNMQVEAHSLVPDNVTSENTYEEEVSTLLIARRRMRYIAQYARDPWDVLVRDCGWSPSDSLDKLPKQSKIFPNPCHLSEKNLLASNYSLRVVSTSTSGNLQPTVGDPQPMLFTQQESADWRRFGGQIPEVPRLFSENRTSSEWKIVLQLPEGNWSFARYPRSADNLLAQMQSLLRTLTWFRKQSVFLNNIRFDTIAVNGPKTCLLSLERLHSQETEDTISALLWLWYDLGSMKIPFRPWPIESFPDEKLSEIPEPLRKMSQAAAASPSLDHFLQNFSSFFSKL